jgi:ATP-binding cassette subfamily C (CFTR/MRP) protein 1
VVLWATHPNLQIQNLPLAASILAFVTALILAPLSYLEHSRSMRPSTLLNVYLFLTLLFDAAMLRTIWLMPSFSSSIREIYTASFAVKDLSPEEFSGIYSRGLFWWLNKMIWAGTKQILKPMDLYPITKDMAAETLSHQFRERWDAGESFNDVSRE